MGPRQPDELLGRPRCDPARRQLPLPTHDAFGHLPQPPSITVSAPRVLVEVGLLHSHSATDDILADLTVALRCGGLDDKSLSRPRTNDESDAALDRCRCSWSASASARALGQPVVLLKRFPALADGAHHLGSSSGREWLMSTAAFNRRRQVMPRMVMRGGFNRRCHDSRLHRRLMPPEMPPKSRHCPESAINSRQGDNHPSQVRRSSTARKAA